MPASTSPTFLTSPTLHSSPSALKLEALETLKVLLMGLKAGGASHTLLAVIYFLLLGPTYILPSGSADHEDAVRPFLNGMNQLTP